MSRLRVAAPRTERMTTRDGTVLAADIWMPVQGGPYPVLLMRQAYGRKIGTSLCYAPPRWYAEHGFIVVLQDVRGRGSSGGDFELFRHEAADGVDSVAWAATLPNSNGRVGMFGFSFQGTNQLLAAMGACVWRDADGLDGPTSRWWVGGSGRTAIDMRDGRLEETAPKESSDEDLVHDPWRPPAPVGGRFGAPPGPVDRHASDARADVLTFTTAPFTAARLLCGAVLLQLDLETEATTFDLHGVLSRVTASGAAYPLVEGYGIFTEAEGPFRLPMRATCATIAVGERLRLSFAAACFPAFPVNPGTGMRPWEAELGALAVITLRVRTGADSRSVLDLPLSSVQELSS